MTLLSRRKPVFSPPLNPDELAAVYNAVDALDHLLHDRLTDPVKVAIENAIADLCAGHLPPALCAAVFGRADRPPYTKLAEPDSADTACAIYQAAKHSLQTDLDAFALNGRGALDGDAVALLLTSAIMRGLDTTRTHDTPLAATVAAVATFDTPVFGVIPTDPERHDRYVGMIIGLHVGMYAGIRDHLDPFHLGSWHELLARRHQQLFGEPISLYVRGMVSEMVTAVSGEDALSVDTTYGSPNCFRQARHLARTRTNAGFTAIYQAYATLGVTDVTEISFAAALEYGACALDEALVRCGLERSSASQTSPPPEMRWEDTRH